VLVCAVTHDAEEDAVAATSGTVETQASRPKRRPISALSPRPVERISPGSQTAVDAAATIGAGGSILLACGDASLVGIPPLSSA